MLSPAPAHRIIIIVFHKKDWYNIRLSVLFFEDETIVNDIKNLSFTISLRRAVAKSDRKEKNCQSALRLRINI